MIQYALHTAVVMWLFVATIGAPTVHYWCEVPVAVADCGCPVEEHNPCCDLQVTFELMDLPAVLPYLPIVLSLQISGEGSVIAVPSMPGHSDQLCRLRIDKFSLSPPFIPTQTTHLLI